MPIDDASAFQYFVFNCVEKLRNVSYDLASYSHTKTHLVIIDNPGLQLIVPSLMTLTVLDNLVDGQMSQPGFLSKLLAVDGLADTRRPCDNDIW